MREFRSGSSRVLITTDLLVSTTLMYVHMHRACVWSMEYGNEVCDWVWDTEKWYMCICAHVYLWYELTHNCVSLSPPFLPPFLLSLSLSLSLSLHLFSRPEVLMSSRCRWSSTTICQPIGKITFIGKLDVNPVCVCVCVCACARICV